MAAPVSARFLELVRDSHEVASRVEVLGPTGAVLLDSDSPSTPLDVVGGQITVDGTASFRRYINNLLIVDATGALVPTTAADYFSTVANNELRLSVGVMVDDTPEYVVQGIFHLEGAKTTDEPGGLTIALSAYDRARKYSRAKRTIPKVFDASASTLIRDAIVALLQDAYPGTTVINDGPGFLTPSQVLDTGGDPWEFARVLASSMGYDLYFDRVGNCVLSRVADPNDPALQPSWIYAEGSDSALLTVERDESNEQIFNGVVLTGENPSNGSPVRDVVWDDNPASPTYYLGPYGRVPTFIQSDKVRTVDQATAAATAELNKVKGLTEAVTFSIVPNPAIEPGDAVKITRARSKFPASGPGSEALVVDSYTVGLSATDGPMTLRCRQRRLA